MKYRKADFSLLSELERIRKEVLEDLIESLDVRVDVSGKVGRQSDFETEVACFCDGFERRFHKSRNLLQRYGRYVRGNEARFDLRQIEDVIDKLNQVVTA